jgi:DNA topoisomerase IB
LPRPSGACRNCRGNFFQYPDEGGVPYTVRSQDVNAYVRDVASNGFSSRQFRIRAATKLGSIELVDSRRGRTRQINGESCVLRWLSD